MSCTRPIPAWRPVFRAQPVLAKGVHQAVVEDIDRRLSFSPTGGEPISVPCGKCPGCARSRAAMWTTRLYHERLMHTQISLDGRIKGFFIVHMIIS